MAVSARHQADQRSIFTYSKSPGLLSIPILGGAIQPANLPATDSGFISSLMKSPSSCEGSHSFRPRLIHALDGAANELEHRIGVVGQAVIIVDPGLAEAALDAGVEGVGRIGRDLGTKQVERQRIVQVELLLRRRPGGGPPG